jgi:predicted esterase
MQESIFQLESEWFFVRHTGFYKSKPVVLFIHGLGESGLCFSELAGDRPRRGVLQLSLAVFRVSEISPTLV